MWAGGASPGLEASPQPFLPSQAKNYMKGLPELEKKDFASILTNASPLGRTGIGSVGSVTSVGTWDPLLRPA